MTHSTVAGSNQQPITLDPRFADEWSVLSPLNGDSDFVPLKLLDPATTDLLSPSHPILEAIADSITGRHQSTIRYELRLCFGRYLRDGFFKYNAGLFGFIHNTKVRDKFKEVIEGVSKITKGYVRGVTSFRRVFILPGILRKGASYIGSRKSALTCDPCLLLWLPIPCSWLTSKYEAWSNYCYVKNLSQNLDCDGRTDWGTALRTAHLKMTVPKNLPDGLTDEAIARHTALTETGVPNIAYLTHGRVNHPTAATEAMEVIAYQHLGFIPHISIK